jgi:hypothetical protein
MTTRDVAQVGTDGIRACVTLKFESRDSTQVGFALQCVRRRAASGCAAVCHCVSPMQIFDSSAVSFEALSKILTKACSKRTASAEGDGSRDPFMAA